MYWISKAIHLMGRFKRRALVLFAVIGPGVITMVADNDAGAPRAVATGDGNKGRFQLVSGTAGALGSRN